MTQISFGKIYSIPVNTSNNKEYWHMYALHNALDKSGKIQILYSQLFAPKKLELDSCDIGKDKSVALLYVNDGYDRYKREVYSANTQDNAEIAKQRHAEESIPITMNTTADDILQMEKE